MKKVKDFIKYRVKRKLQEQSKLSEAKDIDNDIGDNNKDENNNNDIDNDNNNDKQ